MLPILAYYDYPDNKYYQAHSTPFACLNLEIACMLFAIAYDTFFCS